MAVRGRRGGIISCPAAIRNVEQACSRSRFGQTKARDGRKKPLGGYEDADGGKRGERGLLWRPFAERQIRALHVFAESG